MQINAHDALFKAAFSQVEHAAGELRLSPRTSGTDGFFVAVLERAA